MPEQRSALEDAFEQGPLYSASVIVGENWCRIQFDDKDGHLRRPTKPANSLLPMLADNRSHIERIIRKRYKNKLPCEACQVANNGTNKIFVLEYRRGTSGTWLELPRRHIAKRRGGGLVVDFHDWTVGGSATLQLRWRTYNVKASATGGAPSGYTEVSGARSRWPSLDSDKEKTWTTWKVYLSTAGSAGGTLTYTVPNGTKAGCRVPIPIKKPGEVGWRTLQTLACPTGQTPTLKLYGDDALKARWLYCPEYGQSGATCSRLRILDGANGHTRETEFAAANTIPGASLSYGYEGVGPSRQLVFEYTGNQGVTQARFVNPDFYYNHSLVCE